MDCIRHGRCAGPLGRRLAEKLITCWVCGRPLAAGEDFGQWRIRAVRPSALWDAEVRCICPDHYAPDAKIPPPPLPVWLRFVPSPAKKTDGGSPPRRDEPAPDE